MTSWVWKKESSETVIYVVNAFIKAGIEDNQIIAVTRTMKDEFGLSSEDETEEVVKRYLVSQKCV
ncbi:MULTISPECIES: hypothetical protein [Peribacillus]|jgi:hypothetical protein|uniref:hypothetical protein n=1 Tax=Peribacillus TaxID=2675229 RepID=UPI00207AAD27|nr:hypothetical protein [Peribacillus asahii]USK70624.1 hypothetical protein LIS76_02055 [Peribacillus asahii]USK85490.1 hypothetical protein LIT35_01975 [Peribacillus asahii]